MFELIAKENNYNYGIFRDIKSLIKQIRKIIKDEFNFKIFMETLKDENNDLSDLDYLIDVCNNWGFIVVIKGVV